MVTAPAASVRGTSVPVTAPLWLYCHGELVRVPVDETGRAVCVCGRVLRLVS